MAAEFPSALLARRMSRMRVSAVREILKVTDRPDILSFAGGLPAPELFPVAAIAEAHAEALATAGRQALQYSTTEGFLPLREFVAARLAGRGIPATAEYTMITTGSQQGIDLVGKILVDPGDVVVVDDPSYLAAIQVMSGYEAQLEPVASDDEGMRIDLLEAVIARRRPKLIYLVTDFQNPRGTSMSLARRIALLAVATREGIPILEDDPYGELRYSGQRPPSLAALDSAGIVMQIGTFSKTLAPGLRIGWLAAPPELFRAAVTAKQAADLHSPTLAQRAIHCLLSHFDYDGHLASIRAVYGERRDAMLAALERHMPPGTSWTRPDGGLFLWLRLPGGLSADGLLAASVEEKVAFVPGSPFFARNPPQDFMRLNFSNRPPDLIAVGIERLARVIGAALAASLPPPSPSAPGAVPRS